MLVERPDKEFSAKKTYEFFDVKQDLLKWLISCGRISNRR